MKCQKNKNCPKTPMNQPTPPRDTWCTGCDGKGKDKKGKKTELDLIKISN